MPPVPRGRAGEPALAVSLCGWPAARPVRHAGPGAEGAVVTAAQRRSARMTAARLAIEVIGVLAILGVLASGGGW